MSKPIEWLGYFGVAAYTAFALLAQKTIFPSESAYDFSFKAIGIFLIASFILFFLFLMIDWCLDKILKKLPNISPIQRSEGSKKFFWLTFLGCVGVLSIYLIIAYPALITTDTQQISEQALTGNYTNYHTIFYTIWFTIAYKIYHSYATVAIFQILFASFTLSYITSYFYTKGFHKAFLWVMLLFLLLLPSTGLLVVTLWKDVPYSFSVVCASFLLYRLFTENGFLDKNSNILLIALYTASLVLLRYNGIIPFTFMLLCVVIWGIIKKSKKAFMVCLLSLVFYAGVEIGLSKVLKVSDEKGRHTLLLYQAPIYNAYYYGKDDLLLEETRAQMELHKSEYEELSFLLHYISYKVLPFSNAQKEYFNLLKKDPLLVLRAHLNRAVILWNITPEAMGWITVSPHVSIFYKNQLSTIFLTQTGIWIVLALFLSWFLACRGHCSALLLAMQSQDYRYIWNIFLSVLVFCFIFYLSLKTTDELKVTEK